MSLDTNIALSATPPPPPDLFKPYLTAQALRTAQMQQQNLQSEIADREEQRKQRQISNDKAVQLAKLYQSTAVNGDNQDSPEFTAKVYAIDPAFGQAHEQHRASIKNLESEAANRETSAERLQKHADSLISPAERDRQAQENDWLAANQLPNNPINRLKARGALKATGVKLTPGEVITGAPGQPPLVTGPKQPLKFTSNAATGGLETIQDPSSGTTYHAGNIATAPPEVKSAWDAVIAQQKTEQSYKESQAAVRDKEILDRQSAALNNALTKKDYDTAKKVITTSNSNYQDAMDRMSTMEKAVPKALAGDQQAMVNILANHIGMTLGAQKGARITQAVWQEAQSSSPWLQKVEAKFDSRGYLSGVTLTPEQIHQMTGQAHDKVDVLLDRKQRDESDYHDALGAGTRKPAAKGSDPLGIR